jgi:O-antigen/teichoic acid export membrane protein
MRANLSDAGGLGISLHGQKRSKEDFMNSIVGEIVRRGIFTGVAMSGPIAVAGSHFLLSIVLIPHVSATEYGVYAFGMVLHQISNGVSDGLVSSPMAVRGVRRDTTEASMFAFVSLLYCIVAALIIFLALIFLTNVYNASLFSIFCFFATLKWFGRGYFISTGSRFIASVSDIFYAMTLVGVTTITILLTSVSLAGVFFSLIAAALISVLVLGKRFLRVLSAGLRDHNVGAFLPVWKQQSSWSVTAVVANSVTIESHTFVVTLLSGPHAYLPVAIATLCFRPNLIGLNSLSQYERPHFSKLMTEQKPNEARKQVVTFVVNAVVLWFLNVLVVILAITLLGDHFATKDYDRAALLACVIAMAVVMLVRSARQPFLTFAQANNRFRTIASVTLALAPVSVSGACIGLFLGQGQGAIYGMLIADVLLFLSIFMIFKKFYER